MRVLEAELPPGVKEQVHSQPAYVIYVLAGGRYRNYAADGKTTGGELKTGDVVYRDPLTHAAENIGDTTLHLILVELKTPASRQGADAGIYPQISQISADFLGRCQAKSPESA